jgi:hypothetical protein
MDSDFILGAVIAVAVIGLIVFLSWWNSRGRRQVVKAITAVQESLKLALFVGTHPQLDSVWIAVRGQLSGVTLRIFGGRSRRGRNTGIPGGSVVTPIDRAFALIVVTLPTAIPFRCFIQRRPPMSAPRFGTSYEEFDKNIEVITDNEKKALSFLNSEQLRNAIVSFIKAGSSAYITGAEAVVKVSPDKPILPVAKEAMNLGILIANQIKKNAEDEKIAELKKAAGMKTNTF